MKSFPLNLFYEVQTFEVNRPLRDAIQGLNPYQPDILVGYGTALKALAEKQLEGELNIKPETVTNSGEPLIAADRQIIERALRQLRPQLLRLQRAHVHGIEGVLVEVHAPVRGRSDIRHPPRSHAGDEIMNRTLPLIRYKMTDILSLVEGPEHRPYRAIAEVAGRVEQIAKFKNRHGSIDGINPHTITEIVVPNVRQFQMRLKGPEAFDFAIVLTSNASPEETKAAMADLGERLKAIMAEKEMENVRFEIVRVDSIPVDPKTRKFRLIVDAPAGIAAHS